MQQLSGDRLIQAELAGRSRNRSARQPTAHRDPFLPVTNGSYGVPQLRFAQSLYDCGVGAQVSHLTPPTHALAEGSSDTCSPKDNRPDLNL
jgi:hypothetical protein